MIQSFNPRARAGRDAPACMNPVGAPVFQSTRPRGARRSGYYTVPLTIGFQSTRPRGARLQNIVTFYSGNTFQSTRPRGARQAQLQEASALP